MNPQQLRQIIQQQIQLGLTLAKSSADGASQVSLAAATRRIANQLESQRKLVATPLQPLPSAECLAAFVEHQTTDVEEQQIVASCIHDIGILFQLVNIFDQQMNPVAEPVPASVMAGLLALGPTTAVPPAETPNVSRNRRSDRPQTVTNTDRQAVRPRSRDQSHSSVWFWTIAAVVAATALFAGFIARYLITREAKPSQDQLSVAPQDGLQLPAPNPVENKSPWPGTDSNQIAEENGKPPLPDSDLPELAVEGPSQEKSPWDSPSLIPVPEAKPAPLVTPAALAVAKFGHWEKVIGIVATSPDREYPVWQAVKESDQRQLVGETNAFSWMTPPGCYAQTTFGDQGKLIFRENSLASFRIQADASKSVAVCELEYGAIFIANTQASHHLQIDADSIARVRLDLDQVASVVAWIEDSNLRLLPQGDVKANGQLLVDGKVTQVAGDTLAVVQEDMEVPDWCQQLPKESVLSRAILGNLDQSNDLAKSVDQQLLRLLSRPSSTPQALKLVQQLAQWRVALDSDSPLRSARNPIAPVRMALFSSLLSDTTEKRFLAARRSLLGRLQPDDARRRLLIVRLQGKPNRQDLAAWLNELTGDDIELAALADFMFRTQAATGPEFDPTAPRAKRELARREWIKAVTGR